MSSKEEIKARDMVEDHKDATREFCDQNHISPMAILGGGEDRETIMKFLQAVEDGRAIKGPDGKWVLIGEEIAPGKREVLNPVSGDPICKAGVPLMYDVKKGTFEQQDSTALMQEQSRMYTDMYNDTYSKASTAADAMWPSQPPASPTPPIPPDLSNPYTYSFDYSYNPPPMKVK